MTHSDRIFKKTVERFLCHLERNLPEQAKQAIHSDPWERACIAAFWSGPIESAEKWRTILCSRSRGMANILENSLLHFAPRIFFRFFPLEQFVNEWPFMREYCPRAAFVRRGLYDMIWSLAVANSPFVPPLPQWFELSSEERTFLVFALKKQGQSEEEYSASTQLELAKIRVFLASLLEKNFLQGAFIDGSKRFFRKSAYITSQVPRPRKKITYVLKKDGKKRTLFTSSSY